MAPRCGEGHWERPYFIPQTTRQKEINQTARQAAVLPSGETEPPVMAIVAEQVTALNVALTLLMLGQSFLLWICPQSLLSFLWKTEDRDRGLCKTSATRTGQRELKGSLQYPRQGELGPRFRGLMAGTGWVWLGKGQSCACTHEKTVKTA